jgi:hypothetical protein
VLGTIGDVEVVTRVVVVCAVAFRAVVEEKLERRRRRGSTSWKIL